MGTKDNGLTLEGLAQRMDEQGRENAKRLETLERENAGLREEVAALRGKAKDGAMAEAAWDSQGRVSRKALLTKAGAAAVAAMAAGTLLYPREAKAVHFGADITSNNITTHKLLGLADNAISFNPIEGRNTHAVAAAVYAENSGSGPGVRGVGGLGVWGSSSTNGNGAVYGQHTGTDGTGVVGDGKGTAAGVLGRNSSTNVGIGVKGQGNIIGLKGESTNGYGGHFQGARAQVKLLPNPNVGRPTTGGHQQGELFLDSAAKLFICTVSGTPGTWRKVATTVA